MIEQWQELKETITEMRDNDGIGTQQEVCKFLVNYMEILEKQMQEPILNKMRAEIEDYITHSPYIKSVKDCCRLRDDVMRIIDKYKVERRE